MRRELSSCPARYRLGRRPCITPSPGDSSDAEADVHAPTERRGEDARSRWPAGAGCARLSEHKAARGTTSAESLYDRVERRDERTPDAARELRAAKWLQDSCPGWTRCPARTPSAQVQ